MSVNEKCIRCGQWSPRDYGCGDVEGKPSCLQCYKAFLNGKEYGELFPAWAARNPIPIAERGCYSGRPGPQCGCVYCKPRFDGQEPTGSLGEVGVAARCRDCGKHGGNGCLSCIRIPQPDEHRVLRDRLRDAHAELREAQQNAITSGQLARALFDAEHEAEALDIADGNTEDLPRVLGIMWTKTKLDEQGAFMSRAVALMNRVGRQK